jgi:hypothetical protein
LLTILLVAAASGILYAQAVTASLLGTVTDASGAVVPRAKVTITEMNTGISRKMETNARGNYAFPALEPGSYRVSVEQTGFRAAVKEGIDVLVNTTVRADLVLQPGAITEQIAVTAEVPILQTDRSDTGRQPHSEFFNSQGVLATQVNGVSREANNLQFEGVDNNHCTGLLNVLTPPIEALETVDVSTSNYEAELGRAGGAVINIMLKSGTNDLHGAAYWFHSDSALGARETFQATKPVTTVNNYGFNIGGPIRRNRTFFFGDFMHIKDRRGDGYIISVPPPNLGAGLTNNYSGATTRKKDSDLFDVKIDHQQTGKDRFSVRYSFQRPVVTDPGRFGLAGGGGKGFAASGVNRTQSAAITKHGSA